MSVNALAAEYAVTTETVRRDLSALERAGVLRRVHGGAVPAAALTALESSLAKVTEQDLDRAADQDRIAARAVELLPEAGGSVLLDAGPATTRLARMIPRDRRLTVLTNAVPVAAILAGSPNVELHLLPGRVRPTTQGAIGDDTVAALHLLRADVAFVSTSGLSEAHGHSVADHAEAAAKRAMVGAARRVVVLTDSAKVGQEHTVRFARVADVDVVVTDAGIDGTDRAALERHHVEVVVV